MKVIGYVRVSTDEQALSGLGLDAQRASIEAEVKRRGWELVGIVSDAAVSARRSPADRPGFAEVLEVLVSGRAEGVVVSKLDRLTRSLSDFAGLLDQSVREGWGVVALDVDVDTTTATGRLVAHVMASVSEWERGVISERTRAALSQLKAQGRRLGRPVSLPEGVRDRIADERTNGATLRQIAEGLNRDQVATAQGGAQSWPATVRAVLSSMKLDSAA